MVNYTSNIQYSTSSQLVAKDLAAWSLGHDSGERGRAGRWRPPGRRLAAPGDGALQRGKRVALLNRHVSEVRVHAACRRPYPVHLSPVGIYIPSEERQRAQGLNAKGEILRCTEKAPL